MSNKNVWLLLVVFALFGAVSRAEIIIRTQVEPSGGPYTSVSSDNRIESQYVGNNYRTSSLGMRHANANRVIIPFMRFDISSLRGLDLSGATFSHTITWESNTTTVTLDVWGLKDGPDDYWDSSTLTWNLATGTLGWLTWTTDGSGTYTNYTPNTDLWVKLGTVAVSVSAGSPNLTVTTNPTDCNLDAFLNADTNGLVTLALMSGVNNHWCTIASADMTGIPDSYRPTLTFPLGTSNPQPAHNSTVVNYSSLTQLCWENRGIPRYEVWFGPGEATAENYRSVLTRIAAVDNPASSVCVDIPAGMLPLTAPQTYTWALELYRYPDWDPNQTTEPNQLVRADLYRFMTSSVPTVNTSPADQYKFPAETAVFTAVFNAISPVTGAVWYKDGQALNPADPDVTIAITNGTGDLYTVTLTLANVETADDGAYTCVAENVGGSSAPTEAAYLVIKRPIAYWPLEGNADDAVNGYDGTLLGSPVFEAGKVGQAMVFDGLNDWIDLPDGFANFRSGLTFTVWAKPTATASWARFFDFGNGADAGNIYFSRNGTGADLTFSTLGGSVTASGVLALNEWQWFAVTVDETGNAVIYKNGVSVQTGTVTIPAVVTRTSNFLGKSNWAADALYKGLMDEIRLYNYALTADEIATLYADVAGPFCRTSLSYDLNKDCVVDLQDVAKLAEQWLTCGYWPSPCPPLP